MHLKTMKKLLEREAFDEPLTKPESEDDAINSDPVNGRIKKKDICKSFINSLAYSLALILLMWVSMLHLLTISYVILSIAATMCLLPDKALKGRSYFSEVLRFIYILKIVIVRRLEEACLALYISTYHIRIKGFLFFFVFMKLSR